VEFEWDTRKAAGNLSKHGVSFEEANEVFGDPLSSTVDDPDHSDEEARLLIFGQTQSGRHLVVSFTDHVNSLRIISARDMTRRERRAYEQ
jgi:hypothetical protein